jgi:hypothetical protein
LLKKGKKWAEHDQFKKPKWVDLVKNQIGLNMI